MRVVLDTNILVSALLFANGRLAWLRGAWQSGAVVPVVCPASAEELLRVLAYPKFRLTDPEREELLADILPYAEVFPAPENDPAVPECRDPADRIFLQLARGAKVSFLVTGDADLLVLAPDFSPPIVTAEQLLAVLEARHP
jgi:putative PIN family toxin of toxin-antitoxin system